MSREVMSECLDEAANIVNHKWYGDTGEGEGDMAVTVAVHRLAIATIAVALYQERCRKAQSTMKACAHCGEPFEPTRKDNIYCSPAHKRMAHYYVHRDDAHDEKAHIATGPDNDNLPSG